MEQHGKQKRIVELKHVSCDARKTRRLFSCDLVNAQLRGVSLGVIGSLSPSHLTVQSATYVSLLDPDLGHQFGFDAHSVDKRSAVAVRPAVCLDNMQLVLGVEANNGVVSKRTVETIHCW